MRDWTTIWKNLWPIQQGWQWLTAPRDPLTWAALRTRLTTLLLPGTYGGRFAVLGVIVLLLVLVLPWYAKGHKDKNSVVTYPNAAIVNPILGGFGALFLIYAAIRQAQIAGDRHEAQTKADLQRRITESFSKAVEQLGSDKLEVRLGGIYALERISKESAPDYWTVMENLTAFVRERTQRTEAERMAKPRDQRVAERAHSLWESWGRPEGRSEAFWAKAVQEEAYGEPPAADVAAVLTVIKRRSAEYRELEGRLDFRRAFLRRAFLGEVYLKGAWLNGAHLEGAYLDEAHLEGAYLDEAHLEGADLFEVHLEGASLKGAHLEGAGTFIGAHLERAYLDGAHLEGANLIGANLEGASLHEAHLEGASLFGTRLEFAVLAKAHLEGARLDLTNLGGASLHEAHLEGASLIGTRGLTQAEIDGAFGDAETKLPEGLTAPTHWLEPSGGSRLSHNI